MRRLLVAVAAGLTVVALAGAVGLPDLATAQDAPAAEPDTVTVTGVGSVESVPNEARMSFGVESRAETARAAVSANADAMRKVINALRQAGAREIATQWVSVYPVTGETGAVQGFAASNSVSAVADVADAPAVIDAAAAAGANQISGPGLSRSDSERLYRDALAKAVEDARLRAEALARAAGRSLGAITSMVEGGGAVPLPYADRAAVESSTPIEPGKLETTATVSVTFSLR